MAVVSDPAAPWCATPFGSHGGRGPHANPRLLGRQGRPATTIAVDPGPWADHRATGPASPARRRRQVASKGPGMLASAFATRRRRLRFALACTDARARYRR